MKFTVSAGRLRFSAGGFGVGPGAPVLELDGKKAALRPAAAPRGQVVWRNAQAELTLAIAAEAKSRLRVTASLRSIGRREVTLNHVTLFATPTLDLGRNAADVRILEQNAYIGRVRTPRQMLTGSDGLKALDGSSGGFVSHNHTVFHC
ncbi:MAG: hypothetical protein F9K43_20705, partial [Bauldia sp.]